MRPVTPFMAIRIVLRVMTALLGAVGAGGPQRRSSGNSLASAFFRVTLTGQGCGGQEGPPKEGEVSACRNCDPGGQATGGAHHGRSRSRPPGESMSRGGR